MQVKALSLKGKGFKGPLKGAEIVVHRRWVKRSEAEVFQVETANSPPKVFRVGTANSPLKVFRVGTANSPLKVFRVGTAQVFRGEPVEACRALNIRHPKLSLHPLKVALR